MSLDSWGGYVTGSAFGPLPHAVQTSGCGEVYALVMALRLAGPEAMEIVTDCKAVLDTWTLGPTQDLEK
eukprot:3556593-Pyramimonas_sp.AAC.1